MSPSDAGTGHAAERPLSELILAWRQHVDRLQMDCRPAVEGPYTWGMHDLFAALVLRSMVEDRLSSGAPPDLRGRGAVDAADEVFRGFTELDSANLLAHHRATLGGDGSEWWWQRIPKAGLAREELEASSS